MKFNCIHCNQSINAPEEMSGLNANCPTCASPITVPDHRLKELNDVEGIQEDDKVDSEGQICEDTTDPNSSVSAGEIMSCIFQIIKSSKYTKITITTTVLIIAVNFYAPIHTSYPYTDFNFHLFRLMTTQSLYRVLFGALPYIALLFVITYFIEHFAKKNLSIVNTSAYAIILFLVSIADCLLVWERWTNYYVIMNENRAKATQRILDINREVAEYTFNTNNLNNKEWNRRVIFGIELSFPGEPSIKKVSAPMETGELIKNGYYDQAMLKKSDYEIVFSRIVRSQNNIDLAEIMNGTISDLSNHHLVSNVNHTSGERTIDNFATMWAEVTYNINNQEWCTRYLIFHDGPTLWMLGMTAKGNSQKHIWEKVLDSIRIRN